MDAYRISRGKVECVTVNIQKYGRRWLADVTFHRKGDNHTYFNATPSSIRRAQRAQLAAALATTERAAWCEVCGLPAEHCRENH